MMISGRMNGDAKIRNSNDEIFMLIGKDKIRERQGGKEQTKAVEIVFEYYILG